MIKFIKIFIWGIFLFFFTQASIALPPGELTKTNDPWATMIVDNTSFIHANYICMFVTNHGNFGRDFDRVFDYDYGTFFPYRTTNDITFALPAKSPLYAAGLWVGGKVNGEIRVAASEYASEYVPGPMVGGTFQSDRPEFKVYKLHRDSLSDNPNDDYSNWPADQGTPVDANGAPIMLGDQLLWTVFNDADPDQHINVEPGGSLPLGVEVHLQAWSQYQEGTDIVIYSPEISITQIGNSEIRVAAEIVEPNDLTGDSYKVAVEGHPQFRNVWHLINTTSGDTLLLNQTDFESNASSVVEGLVIKVTGLKARFAEFSVVANANGPIDPPEAGAAEFVDFPVPMDLDGNPLRPTDNQQVGGGKWLFHTADNGGTSGGGTRGDYDAFVQRVTRSGGNFGIIGINDYEMRFTGDNSNPGVNGSWALEAFLGVENAVWVPFELWRTGIGTPDDPSDDVRLVPFIIDDANVDYSGDDIYALESWGAEGSTRSGDCEHSVSGGDDDPFTDWVYWYEPANLSPGEAGYDAVAAEIQANPTNVWNIIGDEIMARTVLVNWNGGETPPFTQDVPEQGTIFRITTAKDEPPVDEFTFVAQPSLDETAGYESSAIYMQYKIYNRSAETIEDCVFSLWVDPDLGGSSDDYVGCDTINNLFFCYNADNDDSQYGSNPPAIGFKVLAGPLAPAPGEQAVFDGKLVDNYKNLDLYSFINFYATFDPDNHIETYRFMQGLAKDGTPYTYEGNIIKYNVSGDPVSGAGDLDNYQSDRRMMGTTGPVTMQPSDSQFVLIKMAVGQGTDNLNSITAMKEILNSGLQSIISGDANGDSRLNIADAVYLINYLYRDGSPPGNMNNNDITCNCEISIADAVNLINHIFRGGPAPNCP